VAVSYALLASAMQQVSALLRVQRLDRGFDPQHLTTFQIAPSALKYPAPESRVELYRRIEEAIAQAPGILAVGSSQAMPAGDDQTIAFIPEADHARKPDEWPHAQFRMVSNGYFDALGVAVRRGRAFSALDSKETINVAVINETFARAQFGSVDPVGQRIFLGSNVTPKEIVGVIADVRQRWLIPEPQPEVHIPESQMWVRLPPMYFFVRSSLPAAALVATVRSHVAAVDPIQAVTKVRSMDAVAAEGLAVPRMRATLIAGFALLGMVLATVGLWSVMSQLVAERTPELGIRMALGARPIATIAYVLRSGLWTSTIGVVIGLVCALSLGRVSQSLLAGIESPDIIVLIGAGILLVAIGGAATLLPARRAARINPVEAITQR
jgi:predicted permease